MERLWALVPIFGGSIRGPAAFGGCVGLRPTTNRFSKAGGVSSGAGQESVPAVEGPMARSVDDIDFLMDVYINQANHGWPTVPLSHCPGKRWTNPNLRV